jgi:hypothetical protein
MAQTWIGRESHHHRHAEIRSRPYFPQWIRLCRSAGATRLCVDGSFVTAKEVPNDADAVVLLGPDFATRIARGNVDAILLAEILDSRPNEHLFAAEDRRDSDDWIDFFSRTIDPTVRKGLVEVTL